MAQPRFLFVAGDSDWPGWATWASEAARWVDVATEGSWVAWRLAAANNRELGRSARVFTDLASCREAAARLQREIRRAESAASSDPTGRWGWRLDLDGRPLATSARSYLRYRECHYNLVQFIAAVPAALLTSHVLVLSRDTDRTDRPIGPECPPPGPPRPQSAKMPRAVVVHADLVGA